MTILIIEICCAGEMFVFVFSKYYLFITYYRKVIVMIIIYYLVTSNTESLTFFFNSDPSLRLTVMRKVQFQIMFAKDIY